MKTLPVLALIVFLTANECATSQDSGGEAGATIQLPILDFTSVSTTVSVPDGGTVLIGSRRSGTSAVARTGRDLVRRLHVSNQVCSVTKDEGLTMYELVYDNQPVSVKVHDSGRIEMVVVRTFGENDMDELATLHPDIYMHLRAFPKTSNGDSAIRISIEAETTLKFENVDDLVARHPALKPAYDLCSNYSPVMITVTPRIIIQEEDE